MGYPEMCQTLDVVFDGPPGPTPGRFVEVEDRQGRSVRAGAWVHRDDDKWVLRLRVSMDDIKRS